MQVVTERAKQPEAAALPKGVAAPYDWALRQLRVPAAHAVTRGSKDVVVAVIDLGYRFHPDHEGHLWVNPQPTRGDVHGWDFAEDDASLEFEGPGEEREYNRSHHAFVVGEVAAVAPECPIMVLRVGYQPHHKGSWARAVRYAADHGARVLVLPHGYLPLNPEAGIPLFYQGTDFTYPDDNIELLAAVDDAYQSGCLIFKGTADNRGRRVATMNSAPDSVISVGSSNRHGRAANIAASADYTEVAAPGGERDTGDPSEDVWGTGGAHHYIPFTGGCMAAAFAGGVGALVVSRYPQLTNAHIRQLLRNTAQGTGWNPLLGHGILDAYAAVSLAPEQLCQRLQIHGKASEIRPGEGHAIAEVVIENTGVFDVNRALIVVYNGDPLTPADPAATQEHPNILLRRQIGHAIAPVPGLERVPVRVALATPGVPEEAYAQVAALDVGAAGIYDTAKIGPDSG